MIRFLAGGASLEYLNTISIPEFLELLEISNKIIKEENPKNE